MSYLWVVRPRGCVSSTRFFGEIYCLHLQILLAPPSLYLDDHTLNTELIPSPESSVNMYQSSRLNIQEEMDFPQHCCEGLKSRSIAILSESFNVMQIAVRVHLHRQMEFHVAISYKETF
jgi:hypothetical protein